MKTISNLMVAFCIVATLESCYSSSVYVGKLHPQEDVTCVGTSHNAHFFGGLIGTKKIKAKKYVENVTDYRVKTFHSFVDQLLGSITLGIYTPTTTKFYVNDEGLKKIKKRRNNYDD
ncbi:MAG: Bor family protein [Prevotella sp.]|nr:Bor family protein [Prevotella sp.]